MTAMAADNRETKQTETTAQHTGDGDRDAAKPAPGSGLENRQDRNTQSTDEHRKRSTGGAHSQQTDTTNP